MSKESKPAAQAATSGETYNIVKQHHTKKQIDFFIAVPVNRMERELYLSELDRAKTFGGWKSRKWGKSPSGYGFETRKAAERFAGKAGNDQQENETMYERAKRTCGNALLLFRMGDFYELYFDDATTAAEILGLTLVSRDRDGKIPMAGFPHHQLDRYLAKLVKAGHKIAVCEDQTSLAKLTEPQKQPATIQKPSDEKLADKFQEMAKRLTDKIEDCKRPLSQNWTPKRGRELNSRQREGRHLERTQKALLALAELHSAGELPGSLASFRTKAAIYKALGLEHKRSESDCYEIIELSTFHDKSPEAIALQNLIAEDPVKALERQREQELQSKIDKLRLGKVPGFFPTPETLANRMVEIAEIETGDKCLEPSAGIGTIADIIKTKLNGTGHVCCVEQLFSMAEICQLKGHETTTSDFMEWKRNDTQFDKIIMNPPFEKQQDAKHICRAFEMLAPGGRLVALCGANALNRDNKTGREFQALVNEYGTHNEQIDGAFRGADSFKQTNVSVLLIVLEKPSESLEDLIIEVDNGRTCLTNEQAKLICDELLENEEKYNQLLSDAQHVYNVVSDLLEVERPQDIDGRDKLTWDLVNPPRNDKDGLMNFVKKARTECEKGNAAEAELILVDLLNDLHSESVKFNWS